MTLAARISKPTIRPDSAENVRTTQIVTFVGGAALLLLMALFSLRRLGRGIGLFSLIFSLAAVGAGLIYYVAANKVEKDTGASVAGIGIIVLIAAGAAGLLGGLGALIKPERRD